MLLFPVLLQTGDTRLPVHLGEQQGPQSPPQWFSGQPAGISGMLSAEPGPFWKVKSRTLMNNKSPLIYSPLLLLGHLHKYPIPIL